MIRTTDERIDAAISAALDGYCDPSDDDWPDNFPRRNEHVRGVVSLPTDIWEELSAFFGPGKAFTIAGHVAVHHPFTDEPMLHRSVMEGPDMIHTTVVTRMKHKPLTETVWA